MRLSKIQDTIKSFGDAFQLKEAVVKSKDRKKKSFWSDTKPTDDAVAVKDEDGADDTTAAAAGDDDGGDSDLDLDVSVCVCFVCF